MGRWEVLAVKRKDDDKEEDWWIKGTEKQRMSERKRYYSIAWRWDIHLEQV